MPPKIGSRFATNYQPNRDGVTQSILRSWLDCRQRCEFELNGWEAEGRPKRALRFGAMFHELLWAVYDRYIRTGRYDLRGIQSIKKRILEELRNRGTQEQQFDAVTLFTMIGQYVEYWRDMDTDPNVKWLQTEPVFEVRQFRGVRMPRRGRIDGVLRDAQNHVWLRETKTTSRYSETDITIKTKYDFQVLYYLLAVRDVYDVLPEGVLYDLAKKPSIRPEKNMSPPEWGEKLLADIQRRPEFYFIRHKVPIQPEVIARFEHELPLILREFRSWVNGRRHTYRNTDACFSPWKCEFAEACASGSMRGYAQSRELFEELKEV